MATVSEEVLVRIKADVAELKRDLARASSEINSFGKSTETSMGSLAASARVAGAAIGAVIGSALVSGLVSTITQYEKLQASLKTVTGSAEMAKVAFTSLQDFAATTPFQLEEVVGAFIKLKALGLDPSIEALTSYGNTASAMGKSLNQVMEAVADAATGEFERLKEFGIRAKTQGDGIIFTFQGVSTKVGKNAHEIETYLQSIGNNQFGNAMKEQASTLGVSLSNLGDDWSRLIAKLGDAGARDAIKGVVDWFRELVVWAGKAIDKMQQWSKSSALESTNSAIGKIQSQIKAIQQEGDKGVAWYDRLFGVDASEKMAGLQNRLRMLQEQKAAFEAGLAGESGKGGAAPVADPTSQANYKPLGNSNWGGNTGEDEAKKAAEKAQREQEQLREQIASRLETVQEGLLTESELRQKQFEEDQLTLEQALEQRLLTEEEYLQASRDLESQLAKEKADERAKIEKDANTLIANMRKELNGNIINLLNELGTKNKALKLAAFAFEKALAIQQAIVATHLAAAVALAMDPTGVLSARVTALGYANVAMIAATSIAQAANMLSGDKGGSSGSSVSVSGGGNVLDGTSANRVSSATTTREATIVLQGNTFNAEQVDELIEAISDRMGDGARFTTIRVSR